MRARESILWTAIIYRVKHCAIIVEAQRKLFTFEHSKSRLNGFGSYFPCQIHSHFSYINRYGSWNRSAYCYYYYYQHCVCVCVRVAFEKRKLAMEKSIFDILCVFVTWNVTWTASIYYFAFIDLIYTHSTNGLYSTVMYVFGCSVCFSNIHPYGRWK